MSKSILDHVATQRNVLKHFLRQSMSDLAEQSKPVLGDIPSLEALLKQHLKKFKFCKYLWVLDHTGHQITANVSKKKFSKEQKGRDRIARPYMQRALKGEPFYLSEAYISRDRNRPSLTAIQIILDEDDQLIGFLGADFDLRQLPHTSTLQLNKQGWQQLKGDPAIRGGLFTQKRVVSAMDEKIDDVLNLMLELMLVHGVFHAKFHFSSSRATVWLVDSPYDYQVLNIDELTNPSLCLAFPRRKYFDQAKIPPYEIRKIFAQFKKLRFADENIYLRAASLNLVNEKIGLNFSCDGSHYVSYDEFLSKDNSFWFGVND